MCKIVNYKHIWGLCSFYLWFFFGYLHTFMYIVLINHIDNKNNLPIIDCYSKWNIKYIIIIIKHFWLKNVLLLQIFTLVFKAKLCILCYIFFITFITYLPTVVYNMNFMCFFFCHLFEYLQPVIIVTKMHTILLYIQWDITYWTI